MTPEELKQMDHKNYFVNTYHLYLRPGHHLVEKAGGLHKFMRLGSCYFNRLRRFSSVSLGDLRKITEKV